MLHDAGELVVEREEKIRGGVAKRYRYVVGRHPDRPPSPSRPGDGIAWQRATHAEIVRRLGHRVTGPGASSDIETWVSPDVCQEAPELMRAATVLLHERARPPRSEGTIHVSASAEAFVMDNGS